MNPVISVIISAYNSENFIKEAIDSVLSQTFTDFEFIIINDASTDSTESIIKSYDDPRIKLIKNDKNIGLTKSLNIGIELAKGKYIARMDADDISFPERFQKQFDFMEQNPDIDVCGSWYELFGERNGIINTPENDRDIKDILFFKNCIAHPTVIMRKETLDKYFVKYDDGFPCSQDYELWCRVADRFKFANIPEVLLKYRVHKEQIGTAKRKEQDVYADKIKKKNLNKLGIELKEKEAFLYLNVLWGDYNFKNSKDMQKICYLFNEIGVAGIKKGYGYKFEEMTRFYLKNIAEEGIRKGFLSLKLFITILWKWNVFETTRSKMRYLYHWARSLQ